jgi:hypothetical protein
VAAVIVKPNHIDTPGPLPYPHPMAPKQAELNAIQFAERMLALLDKGNFVATYKYAVPG